MPSLRRLIGASTPTQSISITKPIYYLEHVDGWIRDGFSVGLFLTTWRHVGVDVLFLVYLWGFGLTSIKPNDDSSRETWPLVCGSTARSSLISFHNENEFGVFWSSYQQANHQEQDVTIFQPLFFWAYPPIPPTPTVYDFIAGSYTLFGIPRRNSGKRLPWWTLMSE